MSLCGLLLFPRAHVVVLIPVGFFMHTVRWPASIALSWWFVLHFLSNALTAGGQGGGVAFRAHLGGFVSGMVLVGLFKQPGFRLFNPLRT